ncbi:MAG: SDR family oxidoreductase [Acidobacteria bacterium]|nr:MAG: SDR family oxidoreductase [Acidobacteriota bacterium]
MAADRIPPGCRHNSGLNQTSHLCLWLRRPHVMDSLPDLGCHADLSSTKSAGDSIAGSRSEGRRLCHPRIRLNRPMNRPMPGQIGQICALDGSLIDIGCRLPPSCSICRTPGTGGPDDRVGKSRTSLDVSGQFEGESVVVTGAARGLGHGIAAAFAAEGADVLICDVNAAGVAASADQLASRFGANVKAMVADVSDESAVAAVIDGALDRYGRLDHLINNAGIVRIARLIDVDEEAWDRVIDVNLKGVYLTMRAALPHMLDAEAGSIVNIASQAGKRGNLYIAPYCASKAGVISLTQTAALEAAPHVRVNCVCPGFINTELQEEEYDEVAAITGQDRDEIKASWVEAMPLRRFQEVEDVAASVLYLSSPAASQTTGEALNISGGMVMD